MRAPPIFKLPAYVVFRVNGVGIFLHPNMENLVMLNLTVGHTATLGIEYLDQNGNPMLTAPVPDSPPTWTNNPSAPGVDTFTPSPDGTSATLVADAAGSDSVSLSVIVGSQTFPASLAITISAEAQVLTSVAITSTVS
jgi:hypothetical protein